VSTIEKEKECNEYGRVSNFLLHIYPRMEASTTEAQVVIPFDLVPKLSRRKASVSPLVSPILLPSLEVWANTIEVHAAQLSSTGIQFIPDKFDLRIRKAGGG